MQLCISAIFVALCAALERNFLLSCLYLEIIQKAFGTSKMSLDFLDLTDDAIDHIFQYLPLQEQLAVSDVCDRLGNLMRAFWKRTVKTIKLDENNWIKASNDRCVLNFIDCVKDNAIQLRLDPIDAERFESFCDFAFPQVTTLALSMGGDETRDVDKYVECIAKNFPKLAVFRTHANITGLHLWELTNLEELFMECCENLRSEHLELIFTELKKLKKLAILYYGYNIGLADDLDYISCCESLEVLHLDDYLVLPIWHEVVRLPKLRKLICYTREIYDKIIVKQIVEAYKNRIHSFISNDVILAKDEIVTSLCELTNLRRMDMRGEDVTDEQWLKFGRSFPHLEELRFTKGKLESDQGLLSMIASCNNVKLLDISETQVHDGFLQELLMVLKHKPRTKMEIRCFGTDIADKFVNMDVLNLLRVTVNEHPTELATSRTFSFEWHAAAPDPVDN